MTSLKITQHNHGIVLVTITRPESLNALNKEVLEELYYTLKNSAQTRVLIVTGSGEKAFVAGADIKEMVPMTSAT